MVTSSGGIQVCFSGHTPPRLPGLRNHRLTLPEVHPAIQPSFPHHPRSPGNPECTICRGVQRQFQRSRRSRSRTRLSSPPSPHWIPFGPDAEPTYSFHLFRRPALADAIFSKYRLAHGGRRVDRFQLVVDRWTGDQPMEELLRAFGICSRRGADLSLLGAVGDRGVSLRLHPPASATGCQNSCIRW